MIKTKIHFYSGPTNEMKAQLADVLADSNRGRAMVSHGGDGHYFLTEGTYDVELDTGHVFNNQWNATITVGDKRVEARVFDFARDYPSHVSGCPQGTWRGHYLDMTQEMVDLRKRTLKCGFCGCASTDPTDAGSFCKACAGSEYLDKASVPLTRLWPVSGGDRPEMSDEAVDARWDEIMAARLSAQKVDVTQRLNEAHAEAVERIRKVKELEAARMAVIYWLHGRNLVGLLDGWQCGFASVRRGEEAVVVSKFGYPAGFNPDAMPYVLKALEHAPFRWRVCANHFKDDVEGGPYVHPI